tara:strand:- start:500 stop:1384 length:885 start_codon:yes stop_codon:yes gene_type:complete
MGRKQKFQAVVLSIRIPDDKDRNYPVLLKKIYDLKKSVQVYPGTGMALTSFNEKTRQGTISKFSIIDLDGDWFDESGFGPASEEALKKISIPGNLKPNLISKSIYLDEKDHLIAVMTYSVGKSISPTQVEKFFQTVVSLPEVMDEFGAVQVDLFKDSDEIEALLKIKTLKEVRIVVSRPNHIMAGVAKELEDALKAENADELTRTIKSKDNDYLEPGPHTQALGLLAAENGSVSVKYVDDGASASSNSESKTLIKTIISDDPEATESGIFKKLKDFLFGAVQDNREKAQQVIEE